MMDCKKAFKFEAEGDLTKYRCTSVKSQKSCSKQKEADRENTEGGRYCKS